MLTLKLLNRGTRRTRILETPAVEIRAEAGGHAVSLEGVEFRVGVGLEYDEAYVENSHGSTVHLIRNGEHRAR